GHQAWSARHGPAFHHAIEFETQIVMQPRCRMLLDDEGVTAALDLSAARLGGDVEAALCAVFLEGHGSLDQLAFFRRLCLAVFFLAEVRPPDDLRRAPPRDLPPFSPTLRRSASIRLITLEGFGSGAAGGSLPARFAL